MNYDDIANYFLVPKDSDRAVTTLSTSATRRLRDSVEAIATIGWWSRPAAEAVTALGHGFFDGYVWGRAAALGSDVAPSVVVATFGVFSPTLLVPTYVHGRSVSSHDAILRARESGAAEGLRRATSTIATSTVGEIGETLLTAMHAVEAGPRPLFAALQALPISDDPHARLWRAAELLREHRGDSHLSAMNTTGLSMCAMNVFTETWLGYAIGEYSGSRGFTPEELQAGADELRSRGWLDETTLTPLGRSERDRIEALTDDAQGSVVRALGDRIETVITATTAVSAAVLTAQQAPSDPRKRAAG